jgi:hypothetical protein
MKTSPGHEAARIFGGLLGMSVAFRRRAEQQSSHFPRCPRTNLAQLLKKNKCFFVEWVQQGVRGRAADEWVSG